ncbi:UDP-N-acetylglucosamine 2-epimerase [Fluoribacter dumoffii]|uniref:Polysialic acid biosynthesis protein P7 n=1 Tax=Fluoribacter dumoffii TaxID=463 RepID=A0A377G6Y4_9GAMM|nr:UDP-N-acetylglucosamine 2-epimerase [Fluoribacter dumoffii]KTC91641.1 N-acylglucosamine 2-epimerase [Fluoribacter dumoffii NY 23]MCW8417260.1 UDP-N-acetylglucosamine 2-epimerase [Fluoribacter dumoffii]MCW8454899.1 UDP-N-acetylglucosamine 2-epimerase [Fluoribacter dumoffii]MCW8461024.1 UDP-N-acetylglucosamine 2-epimerase [Fluoribacter dumoffii]MCW8484465.1 UDP-N-acetylglucosamine 2-epimerase [Fluoribacter dumoffii]
MKPRKIIYVTGTRADYGLMREVLKKLDAAPDIDLAVCVTGMHLAPLYGNTLKEIELDEFRICGQVPVDIEQSTHLTMAKSIGYEIIGITEIFAKEQPDLVLVLGDRGEMLAAAIAAVHLNIPIVHLHGGERSGTVDEMIRHAISKLSHYHFVATESSKERLIKMGENESAISVVGAPGLDEIYKFHPTKRMNFYHRYEFDENKKTALLIYHPVVQETFNIQSQFQNAIHAALDLDLQVICLEPNADAGGQLIREALRDLGTHRNVRIIKHLPRAEFIDCLAHVDVMLGNSSSGIIEAASFNLVVVNIGSRQNLREAGDNVIHVDISCEAIRDGLNEALKRPKKSYKNIYGDGNTSDRCYQLLKTISLNSEILNKSNAY